MAKVTIYEDSHRRVGGVIQKVHNVVCELNTEFDLLAQFENFTYITKEAFEMSQQHVIWNYKHINTLLTKNSNNIYTIYNRDDGYFVEDLEPIGHTVEWLQFELATHAAIEYIYSVLKGLPAHVVNQGITMRCHASDQHDPTARICFTVSAVNEDRHRVKNALNTMLSYGSIIGSDGHIREFETHLTKTQSDVRVTTFSLMLYTNMRNLLPSSTIINITEFKERYDAFNIIPPFKSNPPLNILGTLS
jgi:hypothetical protein